MFCEVCQNFMDITNNVSSNTHIQDIENLKKNIKDEDEYENKDENNNNHHKMRHMVLAKNLTC